MKKLFIATMIGLFALNAAAQQKPADQKPVEEKPAAVPDDKVAQEAKAKQAEEAARAAAAARAAERKQQLEDLFKACVIKPVMTDDEIEACKKAYRA